MNILATYDEAIERTLYTAEDIARAIDLSVEASDWQGVGALAHKLKSSARTVGAMELGDRCAELETQGRADNAEAVRAGHPVFRQERARVAQALREALGTGAG